MNNGEDITDLGRAGLRVLQKKAGYRFGMDAVLLAAFARIKPGYSVVDLCAGCGVLSFLMYGRQPLGLYTGVEIQQGLAEMAARSVVMNNLEGHISIVHGDIRDKTLLEAGRYDAVTANPPYLPDSSGISGSSEEKALARHEIACDIGGVCGAAFRLLKAGGVFFMVHRTARLIDVLCALRENRLEPKVLRFVHSFRESPPNLFLVEARKSAAPGMKPIPPLVIYERQGVYTEEVSEIYYGEGQHMRIGEVCLLTDDVIRLANFYKAVLSVDNGGDDPIHQFILSEETTLTIHNDGVTRKRGDQSICLAFTVPDVDAHCERLKSIGIEIAEPPINQPWGARNMSVRDPDGNLVTFRQLPI
ncbi:MAG: VOC family protein [Clostridiales bacterium]|nr:VOC family protein [Clostridiales bacterium]